MNNRKLKNTILGMILAIATLMLVGILPINHIHLRKYGKNIPYFGAVCFWGLTAYIILGIILAKFLDKDTNYFYSNSKVNSVMSFIRIFSFSLINSENRTIARNARDGLIASETAVNKIYVSFGILAVIWVASFIVSANWDKISRLWNKNNIQ